MLISYASCRVIDNIAALPTGGAVVSTGRANLSVSWAAGIQAGRMAAAGERFNRRDL
ncbi:MAG: hypothetical protein M0Z73_10305 [Betaproteobacteria bacterium]|nr:hypothetical protein [Betaproteobacteria bacterium]